MTRQAKTESTARRAASAAPARNASSRSLRQAKLAGLDRLEAAAGLASVFAHDLNQPLTAIMAYCEAGRSELKRPDFSRDKLERNLERSVAQARRASELIRDLRRSISSRRPEGERSKVDLNVVAANARELVLDEAAAAGVEVSLAAAATLPPVDAVQIQLEYVLVGLLRNAIAALQNHSGDKQINISTTLSTAAVPGMVEVSIADTGPGIPPERLQQIFRAFHHDPTGLGMGLWTGRSIAEAHGGKLAAENRQPQGAVFRLQLPASK